MRVLRPTLDRFDETLDVLRAADVAVYGDSDWTANDLRDEWDGLDLERDAWLVELDGRIAGVAHLLDRKGGRFIGDGYVHPAAHRAEAWETVCSTSSRPACSSSGRNGPRTAESSSKPRTSSATTRAPALFRGRGFERARSFFRMVADVSGEQPPPEWPDGIELRPLDVDLHGAALYDAELEAFANEWEYVPLAYDEWRDRVFGRSGFDPSLVPVAWDGEGVVAFSRNYAKRNGDWGFIGTLGVRPGWRRRGLGLSLLHESFRRFRETGETTVALGVDVENPTGATRLYERAGMRVLWQADVWQKELRA